MQGGTAAAAALGSYREAMRGPDSGRAEGKKKARRISDAPSNKTYGNCLLGFHCSQKPPGGNRVFAGIFRRCSPPTENFIHRLCTGWPAEHVNKRNVRGDLGNAAPTQRISSELYSLTAVRPPRIRLKWAGTDFAWAPASRTSPQQPRSKCAQPFCNMKRPGDPLDCRVIG